MNMRAPYRFVPISGWIHEPQWRDQASQDNPFEDGLSGWLKLRIQTRTPLMVGGSRKRHNNGTTEVKSFQDPDNIFAIPGAGLRGPVRAVMEIATFGRGAFIDKVRHGVRDLSAGAPGHLYKNRLTSGTGTAANPIRYRVHAGWLRRDATDNLMIEPCSWAKVHVDDLARLSGAGSAKWEPRADVAGRYAVWGNTSLSVRLNVDAAEQDYQHSGGMVIRYCRAGSKAGGTGGRGAQTPKEGAIVLTGKPANGTTQQNRVKKFEFFFFDPKPAGLWKDISHVWDDFLLIHDETLGAAGGAGNASWPKYWRARFKAGQPVPVFYIEDPSGRIESFGLASMFRLAHELTTHDLLANANPQHANETLLDFPTLLFGSAADSPEEGADASAIPAGRKARVVFETARLDGQPRLAGSMEAVLASPKPQFYPAYVKQPASRGQLVGNKTYASYTPSTEPTHDRLVRAPELAGRKRYPLKRWRAPSATGPDVERMKTIMHPLAADQAFTGRVRFHNLKPAELGALVWSLQLWAPKWGGPRPDLCHSLGMGKPLGMGAVSIDISDALIEPNSVTGGVRTLHRGEPAVQQAQACADAFVDYMEDAFRTGAQAHRPATNATWAGSEQVESLLAMAEMPKLDAGQDDLTYMTLRQGKGNNEFQTAKDARQTLPDNPRSAASATRRAPGTLTDQAVFPRQRADSPTTPTGAPASKNPPPAPPTTSFRVGDRATDIEERETVTIIGIIPGPPLRYLVRYEDGGEAEREERFLQPLPRRR